MAVNQMGVKQGVGWGEQQSLCCMPAFSLPRRDAHSIIVSAGTVEERIVQSAERKLYLDQAPRPAPPCPALASLQPGGPRPAPWPHCSLASSLQPGGRW